MKECWGSVLIIKKRDNRKHALEEYEDFEIVIPIDNMSNDMTVTLNYGDSYCCSTTMCEFGNKQLQKRMLDISISETSPILIQNKCIDPNSKTIYLIGSL